jgi:hypothetical protein
VAAAAGEGGRSLSITSTSGAGSPGTRHGRAAGLGATAVHRADTAGPSPSSTAGSGLVDDATALSPQRPAR